MVGPRRRVSSTADARGGGTGEAEPRGIGQPPTTLRRFIRLNNITNEATNQIIKVKALTRLWRRVAARVPKLAEAVKSEGKTNAIAPTGALAWGA